MEALKCNILSCRKNLHLEGGAVVTTCSHAFCLSCANGLFRKPYICPACETSLPDSDDVVQTDLNPSDSYKTSVLAGLSPTVIHEVAARALNFWGYQVAQEKAYDESRHKQAVERVSALEAQNNSLIREATSEISLLREKLAATEKETQLEKRKVRELLETHKANSKAYTKLKAQHSKLQQRALLGQKPPEVQQVAHAPLRPSPTQRPPTPTYTPLSQSRTTSFVSARSGENAAGLDQLQHGMSKFAPFAQSTTAGGPHSLAPTTSHRHRKALGEIDPGQQPQQPQLHQPRPQQQQFGPPSHAHQLDRQPTPLHRPLPPVASRPPSVRGIRGMPTHGPTMDKYGFHPPAGGAFDQPPTPRQESRKRSHEQQHGAPSGVFESGGSSNRLVQQPMFQGGFQPGGGVGGPALNHSGTQGGGRQLAGGGAGDGGAGGRGGAPSRTKGVFRPASVL